MNTERGSIRSTNALLSTAAVLVGGSLLAVGTLVGLPRYFGVSFVSSSTPLFGHPTPKVQPLDTLAYDKRLLALAAVATSSPWYQAFLQGTDSTSSPQATYAVGTTTFPRPLWPVRRAYPRDSRALLPFNRIVAFYGNFLSTQMGVLGEYPKEEVLQKLRAEVAAWEAADPTTPVVPAIEFIDVTAQAAPGKDGKYRARMHDKYVDQALEYAKEIDGIVILDIQVGLSSVEEELPHLDKYWAMPNVHLAIDPEFDMPGNIPPGRVIGTTDAATINWAAEYLAKFVREHDLPPKILVIHRFTEGMVTNYEDITPLPEVQIVVQMDGWGSPQRKKNTYYHVVEPEPVQFTGLKLFYKNDLKEDPPRLLTKEEILQLVPAPIFIQYQ